MASKLMTLEELSNYLDIREERIIALVDQNVILAYRIGGELLRFRKEQIDAMRSEIETRLKDSDRKSSSDSPKKEERVKLKALSKSDGTDSFEDKAKDFFYFNGFYIIAGVIVVVLLFIIFRG